MDTVVDFSSELFRPLLPDKCQVNWQTFGAELAFWLSGQLAKKGIITSYPYFDEWGWFVEYCVDDNQYLLCCSNTDELGREWCCFLQPQSKGMLGRKKAPVKQAALLLCALSELLEETSGITDIEWSKLV